MNTSPSWNCFRYATLLFFAVSCAVEKGGLQQAIVYTTERPVNYDLFLLDDADKDSIPQRLTDYRGLDYNAVFSPDNRWIVYTSERNGNTDLYALEYGKTDKHSIRLTQHEGADDQAAFSPDGGQLVFMSTRGGNASIYTMRFNSAHPSLQEEGKAMLLTETAASGEFNPAFSPDGKHIAYSSNALFIREFKKYGEADEIATDIFIMDADGSNQRVITDTKSVYGSPSWNAAGTKLIYYKFQEGHSTLLAFDLNMNRSTAVTDTLSCKLTPAFGNNNEIFFAQSEGIRAAFFLSRISSDNKIKTVVKTDGVSYYHPRINSRNQLLCYGNGPTDGLNKKTDGTVFEKPETFHDRTIGEHMVKIAGVAGYAPTLTADGKEVITTEWINGKVNPIVSSGLKGDHYRSLYLSKAGFAWSPVVTRDKQWIVFTCGDRFASGEKKVDIWKVRYNGTDAINLTANVPGNNAFPDVSPDGKWIVFRNIRGKGRDNKDIWLMDSDGNNLRQLTSTSVTETMPAFSPDGTRVIYVRENPVTRGMHMHIQSLDDANDNGTMPDTLRSDQMDMHPRFSPDGQWIVFVSNRAGSYDEFPLCNFNPQPYGEVFVKKIGTNDPPIQITHDKWEDGIPFWGYWQNKDDR